MPTLFSGGQGYSEFNTTNLKLLNILQGISNHTTYIPHALSTFILVKNDMCS